MATKTSGGSSRSKSDGSGYQGGIGGRKGDYSGRTPYDKEVGRNQRMNSITSANTTVVAKNNEGVFGPTVRRNAYDANYTPTPPKRGVMDIARRAARPTPPVKKAAPVAPVAPKAVKKVTQINVPGYPSAPTAPKRASGTKFSNGKTYTKTMVTGGNGGGGGTKTGNYGAGGGSTKAERTSAGRGGASSTSTRNK